MDRYECDVAVIGAGAVGLAVARRFALAGRQTIILEKNLHPGMETSSRNSEVIHAGLYYPKDSLKARLCVEGRDLLYAYCESHGVGFKRIGKLIVAAAPEQESALDAIRKAATGNGVGDLRPISRGDIAALEPDLFATAGLFSPSTGIIDSHQYMLALLGDAEAAGAHLVRDAQVLGATRMPQGYRLEVANGGERLTLDCATLVNSAGLWAQQVARRIEGLDPAFVPPLSFAKGRYATLAGKSPFRHLVYPVPEPGGLGVHLTLDMGGAARFGPDVEWLKTDDPAAIDYGVPADLPERFAPRIAAYWPAVTAGMLAPGYSGVRPKTAGAGAPAGDFRIEGHAVHGLPGLVNLFAIESPGLTASLAIAAHVERLLA